MDDDNLTPGEYKKLIESKLPGEYYYNVLRTIHETLKPQLYLEIGVNKGESLSLARPDTHAIGVDPEPNIRSPLRAWTRIYQTTSDQFFKDYKGDPFDLIFLDGLHHFEVTARDFINAERFCKPTSVILIHDTIPLTAFSSTRTLNQSHWTGDVWKLVPSLIKGRPDLTIFTIACPPSGLTVVKGFTTPKGLSSEMLEEYKSKDFAWINADWVNIQNVVGNIPRLWLSKLLEG